VVLNEHAAYLVAGAVLIPDAAGTLPELPQVGLHYAE
jgi:hypothetical protein